MAARQALSLYEAELPGPAGDRAGLHTRAGTRQGQPHISAIAARTALRAAGLPPHLATTLRNRLRLIPEPETKS